MKRWLQKCLRVGHIGRSPVTCEQPKGHVGRHRAGYVSWPNDAEGVARQPCTCASGCGSDCVGDDGLTDHCSGCAHRRADGPHGA